VESRELRIANLLNEAAQAVAGEYTRRTLRESLIQGAVEMQQRAHVLEERRLDAAKVLTVAIDKD